VALSEVLELLEAAEAKASYGLAINWKALEALTQALLDRGVLQVSWGISGWSSSGAARSLKASSCFMHRFSTYSGVVVCRACLACCVALRTCKRVRYSC